MKDRNHSGKSTFRKRFGGVLLLSVFLATSPVADASNQSASTKTDAILRSKASAGSVPLATLREGRELTIIESRGDWYKVEADSMIGYILKKYVEVDESSSGSSGSSGSASSSSSQLAKGDKGDGVKQLQQSLQTLGYFSGEATGTFGDATQDAVTAFQKANGLTADGVAGKSTLNSIQKLLSSADESNYDTTLKSGSEGEMVKQLQKALKERGYFDEEITGYYGNVTQAAVKAFQQANGISADGVAGEAMLGALLNRESAGAVRLGDTGDAVKELQRLLRSSGFYAGAVDGHFGNDTERALLAFQSAAGLAEDGIAGRSTIAALVSGRVTNAGGPSGQASENSPNQATGNDDPLYVDPGNSDGSSGSNNTADPDDPYTDSSGGSSNGSSGGSSGGPSVEQTQQNGDIRLVDWWSGEIDRVYPRKAYAKFYDIRSGITVNIYHYGGTNHLDWEPATANDMALITQIVNGEYSWAARPVIFIAPNGNRYAAAINTMPHGGYHLPDNNCNGQMCMHFLNSYTHGGNKSNADMQSMVQYAFRNG